MAATTPLCSKQCHSPAWQHSTMMGSAQNGPQPGPPPFGKGLATLPEDAWSAGGPLGHSRHRPTPHPGQAWQG